MIIDSHQHFFDFTKINYHWPTPNEPTLYRNIVPAELEPLLQAAGVDKTIIVQADHTVKETEYMLACAAEYDWIAGVVGWVPLTQPDEAARQLEQWTRNPYFKGMRHLIHDEKDPDWVLQDSVLEGLKVLAAFDVPFDVVAVLPRHLEHVTTLAEKVPGLRMVIDHLAKPPIQARAMEPWARLIGEAAVYPNVYAKVSGLNTAADWERWNADDLKPYIDYVMEKFGAKRLMFGSDWPVSNLAGDYQKVWEETNKAIADYTEEDKKAILGLTAMEFYKL